MRKGNEFDPPASHGMLSTLKKYSTWIIGVKVEVKTIKLLEENRGEYFPAQEQAKIL